MQEACGRRFHREGRITVKDLDLTIVVLAQGTRRTGGPVYPKTSLIRLYVMGAIFSYKRNL